MSNPIPFHPAAFFIAFFAGLMQRGQQSLIDKYTDPFRRLLDESGIKIVRTPPMSPKANGVEIRSSVVDRRI